MSQNVPVKRSGTSRSKFLIGGLLIVAAIIYLIVSSTKANAQYFLTVEEVNQKKSELTGQSIRVSGSVLGDSIKSDPATLDMEFTVAHIPGSQKEIDAMGGMAEVLHLASLDPTLPKLHVKYNGVKPDLLKNEAQAIMTGKLDSDGNFVAEELLLKCPSKYEEALPEQAIAAQTATAQP